MKEYFNDYCELYDLFMKYRGKEPRPKWVKALFFIPFILCMGFVLLIALGVKSNIKQYSYRTDPKYKKVIKEGIFYDTVEYHEK